MCALYTKLPRELRDLIYEYALTDCTSYPPNRDNPVRQDYYGIKDVPPSDMASPLLQTCRAVCLETYKLPMLVNPLNLFDYEQARRPKFMNIRPWQLR
jgi:hypothetical protein